MESDNYLELRHYDLTDVVKAVCNLRASHAESRPKWLERELRTLSKSTALMMGGLKQSEREFVRDCFSLIDFYDVDLVQALKKFNLVKGSSKL